jgi:hypothetical protein
MIKARKMEMEWEVGDDEEEDEDGTKKGEEMWLKRQTNIQKCNQRPFTSSPYL